MITPVLTSPVRTCTWDLKEGPRCLLSGVKAPLPPLSAGGWRAASRRPPPMRRGPPAILSQDPGCQLSVLAVGSCCRGPLWVLTPAPAHTRSYLCLDRSPASLSSAGLGLHAHPCNQLHVGPRTFRALHQQALGYGRVAERQRAAPAGLQSEGHPPRPPGLPGPRRPGPGREGISDKALAKVDEFIRSALNRLWARGPGRMPGTSGTGASAFPAPPPPPGPLLHRRPGGGGGGGCDPVCGQHVPWTLAPRPVRVLNHCPPPALWTALQVCRAI